MSQHGYPQSSGQPYPQQPAPSRSRVAAAVLAFFLGTLGVHNFYLGYTGAAIAQLIIGVLGYLTTWLLIGFFLLGPLGIWVLVEFVLILASNSGRFAKSANGVPLT